MKMMSKRWSKKWSKNWKTNNKRTTKRILIQQTQRRIKSSQFKELKMKN